MENATVAGWKLRSALSTTHDKQAQDRPNYWVEQPPSLISQAAVKLVSIGSGHNIYKKLRPELEEAKTEVVLVTCFWARSPSLDVLNGCLRSLSRKAHEQGCKIRVRICFSSLSWTQKLFHTRSLAGRLYPSTCWVKKFGLPDPAELTGLDMQLKSIFVLPFSVMHPKFIIVDRQKVFLPSCNVSWENWFEGCVELTGPIVTQFLLFYGSFWSADTDLEDAGQSHLHNGNGHTNTVEALFLPSPHHALDIIDRPGRTSSPPTPLNLFTLEAFVHARSSVYIQTPNITARPVLAAILAALDRGINIRIVTSESLMVLEQLVTARTTTARCVRWLLKQHARMMDVDRTSSQINGGEEGRPAKGQLDVSFYKPRLDLRPDDPVQTHLKLMIVDEETVLLGSGNLDRASWVTSQELGVAIVDKKFAATTRESVLTALEGRLASVRI